MPGALALTLGLLVGTACGLVNGLLVTRLKLPPFIATLGTLNVFFALHLWYSESATVRGADMADILLWTGNTFNVGDAKITYGSLLMLALFAVMGYALRSTAWGRHVYATGDDAEAARLAGVRTNRVLLSVCIVAGLICAIAAWVLIGRIASASPQAGSLANLDSITAVVIGGTSLFGGRGMVLGTLFGALIVGVLRNGLALSGVDVLWQDLAVGILVLATVAIDQWIRRCGHERRDPGSGGTRTGQALRPRRRAGRLGLRAAARRDPGRRRRQRRRQIDADQVPVGRGRARRRRDPRQRRGRDLAQPARGRAMGIETVYQTLAMSPALDISSNLFLGREPRRPGLQGKLFRRLDKAGCARSRAGT